MEKAKSQKVNIMQMKNRAFEIVALEDFYNNAQNSFVGENLRTDFYSLIYVREGTLTHELDFVNYTLRSGDIIFISSNRTHKYLELDGAKGYILMFSEGFLCEYLSHNFEFTKQLYRDTFLTPHISRIELYEKLIKKIFDTIYYTYNCIDKNFTYDLIASSIKTLSELMINIIKESNDSKTLENPIFIEFAKLVDELLHKEKSVEAYAKLMHVSKKTINQMTRKAIDVSAKQYIINQIILKIKVMLCFEEISINKIADDLGFSEPSNMSNFFKKYVNQSPKDFRIQNRRNDNWFESKLENNSVNQNLAEQRIYRISKLDNVAMHTHVFYDEIFYCIKGSGIGLLEDKSVNIGEGDTFIAKAGQAHSLKSDDEVYVLSILVPVRTT